MLGSNASADYRSGADANSQFHGGRETAICHADSQQRRSDALIVEPGLRKLTNTVCQQKAGSMTAGACGFDLCVTRLDWGRAPEQQSRT